MYLFKLRTTPIECTCSDNHTCEPCKKFIAHTNAMEDAGMFDPPTEADIYGDDWACNDPHEWGTDCVDDNTPF